MKSSLCQFADMGRVKAGGQVPKGPGKLSPLSTDTYGKPTPPLPFSVLLRGKTGLWLVIVSHVQMAAPALTVSPLLLSPTSNMLCHLCLAVDKVCVC